MVIIALVICDAGNRDAMAITIDGGWTDWGITVADDNNSLLTPGAGITSVIEDTNDLAPTNFYLGPGYGGQACDVEALYSKIEGGYFYFAVVSGVRPDNGFSLYEPGDIVITTDTAFYALETTGDRYNLTTSGYVASTTSTGSAGYLYEVTGTTTLGDGLINWKDKTDNQDPVQLDSVSSNNLIENYGEFSYTGNDKTSQHSFMEGKIDMALLNGWPTTVHFAVACGNDGLTVDVAPIPEPATMLLLGTGLICLAGLGRKKFNKGT